MTYPDPAAVHTDRLGARSGSPFASDRDFRRKSRRDRRRDVVAECGMTLLAVVILAIGFAFLGARDARLVGLDCEGAAGPIYAADESDFPPCRAIEPRG